MKKIWEKANRFTDVKYLLSGSAWLSFNTVVSAAGGIGLALVLGNIFSPTEYGIYKYLTSVVAFLGVFTMTGYKRVIPQNVAKGYRTYFSHGMWNFFVWSLITSPIAIGISLYYLYQDNYVLGYSLLTASLVTPAYFTLSIFGTYSNGIGDFRLLTFENMAYVSVTSITVILTALFTNSPSATFISFILSTTFVGGCIFFFNIKDSYKKVEEQKQMDNEEIISQDKYAVEITFLSFFRRLANNLDNILIFQMTGAASLAVYSFAFAIPRQLRVGQKIIGILALHRFSQRKFSDIKDNMFKKLIIAYFFVSIIIVTYWFAAEPIFNLLLPKYTEAISYSKMLSLTLVSAPSGMILQAFYSHMQKKSLYFYEITYPALRILSFAILLYFFGLWGAVVSNVIMSAYQAVYLMTALKLSK